MYLEITGDMIAYTVENHKFDSCIDKNNSHQGNKRMHSNDLSLSEKLLNMPSRRRSYTCNFEGINTLV